MSCSDAVEQVNEGFWARRASAIQQLFNLWDCNQLSNDAFTVRLQEVLGEAVEVSGPDSEFAKLANRHRAARNMKFASLMSALRRDAQASNARRFGRPLSHTGLSQYAGSYAGSAYDPSEAHSEATSQAAGRPTGAGAPVPQRQSASSAGRQYYSYGESQLSGAVPANLAQGSDRSRQQRRPGGLEGVDERGPGPTYQQPTTPESARRPPSTYGLLPGPQLGPHGRDGFSAEASLPGEQRAMGSDNASVAASQREVFTKRNRSGHGNIINWGNDSQA